MMTVYWQPLDQSSSLRRQLDEVFDKTAEYKKTAAEACWYPPYELLDASDNFILHFHLSGVSPNKVDIQATHKAVAISGNRSYSAQNDKGSLLYSELPYGQFRKVVTLPLDINPEKIQADFQDGVLSLVLPKSERYRTVKVSLNHLSQSDKLTEQVDPKALSAMPGETTSEVTSEVTVEKATERQTAVPAIA